MTERTDPERRAFWRGYWFGSIIVAVFAPIVKLIIFP